MGQGHPIHTRVPRVLLWEDICQQSGRDIIEGVLRYAREHGPWDLQVRSEYSLPTVRRGFADWRPDGVISAYSYVRRLREGVTLRSRWGRLPLVVVGCQRDMRNFVHGASLVSHDDPGIGAIAARSFLARRLPHFAFVGVRGTDGDGAIARWVTERERSFRRTLAKDGVKEVPALIVDDVRDVTARTRMHRELSKWLRKLPRPCGILAAHDALARELLYVCSCEGLEVPGEIAVIGVDNDAMFCENSVPTLSSVDPDFFRCGHVAAETLDRLFRGEIRRGVCACVPTKGVVARASDDYIAGENRLAVRLMERIRARYAEPVRVAELLEGLGASRRQAEVCFRASFGMSPLEALRERRFEEIRRLLARSDVPIAEIAARCGYESPTHLMNLFRRKEGCTMSAWRRAHDAGE